MSTPDALTDDASARRGVLGWLVLGFAAAIDVAVALIGLVAWTSGRIDPSRIDASRIVFALYGVFGVFGAIALLALLFRWRKWSRFTEVVLASFAVTWALFLVGFIVVMAAFGLAA